jgi:plasmid maintenance system antidote protein VapI
MTTQIMPDFSNPQWLTNAMDGKRVKIFQLANASGVSRDQIERLRKDGTRATIKTAVALSQALATF